MITDMTKELCVALINDTVGSKPKSRLGVNVRKRAVVMCEG